MRKRRQGRRGQKRGHRKAALALAAFSPWRCSVGQGFASPNPAGVLFNGLQRTKKSGRLLLEKCLCHGDPFRPPGWHRRKIRQFRDDDRHPAFERAVWAQEVEIRHKQCDKKGHRAFFRPKSVSRSAAALKRPIESLNVVLSGRNSSDTGSSLVSRSLGGHRTGSRAGQRSAAPAGKGDCRRRQTTSRLGWPAAIGPRLPH